MNRETRFRAWDRANNEWRYYSLLELLCSEYGPNAVYHLDLKKVCEWTGLLDKNGKGKEIYEGDVVSWREEAPWDEQDSVYLTGVVEFDNGCWWVRPNQNYSGGPLVDLPLIEVIGNIYENPELLSV